MFEIGQEYNDNVTLYYDSSDSSLSDKWNQIPIVLVPRGSLGTFDINYTITIQSYQPSVVPVVSHSLGVIGRVQYDPALVGDGTANNWTASVQLPALPLEGWTSFPEFRQEFKLGPQTIDCLRGEVQLLLYAPSASGTAEFLLEIKVKRLA